MARAIFADGAIAVVDELDGGRLSSLTIAGFEIIGSATPVPGAPEAWYHGSFPMAPYAGLIRNSTLEVDGEDFTLEPNIGPHTGHGLVFDRPWTVTEHTETRLELSIELDTRWPWGGTATQLLHIHPGRLEMVLVVSNDKEAMPASLGFHPWFVRHTPDGDAVMRFEPRQRYALDADGFPHAPGPDLGVRPWDDVFRDLASAPSISWPGGPTVTLTSSGEVWTLFEQLDEGFCIEPLTAPPNSLGTRFADVVQPGRPLELRFQLAWC